MSIGTRYPATYVVRLKLRSWVYIEDNSMISRSIVTFVIVMSFCIPKASGQANIDGITLFGVKLGSDIKQLNRVKLLETNECGYKEYSYDLNDSERPELFKKGYQYILQVDNNNKVYGLRVSKEQKDIPLRERVTLINSFMKVYPSLSAPQNASEEQGVFIGDCKIDNKYLMRIVVDQLTGASVAVWHIESINIRDTKLEEFYTKGLK